MGNNIILCTRVGTVLFSKSRFKKKKKISGELRDKNNNNTIVVYNNYIINMRMHYNIPMDDSDFAVSRFVNYLK